MVCGQKKLCFIEIFLWGWWGLLFHLWFSKSTSQPVGDSSQVAEGPGPWQAWRKLESREIQVVTMVAQDRMAALGHDPPTNPGSPSLKAWLGLSQIPMAGLTLQ